MLQTALFDGLISVSLTIFLLSAQLAAQSIAQNATANVTLEDCRYFPEEADHESRAEFCTSNYETLEAFVRADDKQIATLARNFYRTGEDPTEYIKITYLFQIPSSDPDDNDDACVPIERDYIWSISPVFLLGPRALFWLSSLNN